ncbi:MAG: recombinase RecA [Candidatus Cloacimonetes bacterium]|nr:recombinase RecA [Candidatus Cloacimonadota bacterium]MCF7813185.1 recombinase RecA [Candidatus Cloacimonadota bacterium]MCF7867633.1 recombinase RecA [Candidatus Cloacimonadota bacterium]MCF7883092.1 recombinase RecA [Candidatus Cloacimonadota bacterium]
MSVKDKNSALKTALTQLDKQFGVGTVMRLGDKPKEDINAIPTGAINLDAALGIGGIPRGRVTEIYGPEASGKTTIALHCVAEAQKQEGVVAFIDVEHALDPVYAASIGVDTNNLLLSQPDGGEQALEIVETLVRSSAIDLIVVDSVAALVPKAEIEGNMGDSHVGLQARLMSQALRKLTGIISKSKTAVIFINQTRMKIGVPAYVNPETTTGGVALKFYSSVRLEVRKVGSIKKVGAEAEIIGNKTRVKIVKNKFAPPFKKIEFPIMFGVGISHLDILIEIAVQHDIVKKSGSWFSYGETKIGQGSERVKDFLNENEEVFSEIEKEVKIILGLIKEEDDEGKDEE